MKQKNKLLQISMGIIVAIMFVAFIQGILFLTTDRPNYGDYCEKIECEHNPGDPFCVNYSDCDEVAYEEAMQSYELIVFFVNLILGVLLLILAIFIPVLFVQIVGYIGGIGLVGMANIYLHSTWVFVISLGVVIALLSYLVIRKVMK